MSLKSVIKVGGERFCKQILEDEFWKIKREFWKV